MASPFLAEVRMFGFNFAPRTWAACNGQLMSIAQNTALFALLGTNYGGDGKSTFGLPNLQGNFPITSGQGAGLSAYTPGQKGGASTVTLSSTQVPPHSHTMYGLAAVGGSTSPVGQILAQTPLRQTFGYGSDSGTAAMASNALAPVGNSQPHNNLPPYLAVNYCIALSGIFPPRP